ncbi:MAG: BrnT family toxin [Bacteroidetes bacterium]|nr:BrnT family toxin [Bacteroidota bacterium]
MKMEWDKAKRKSNIKKYGFDFVDTVKVFDGATFTINDDRFDYGKNRYITLGMLEGIVIVIAHLEEDELIRIISMRKATKNEQKIYFKGFSY